MKLTKEQIQTLQSVFNYALNYLEDCSKNMVFRCEQQDGKDYWVEFDTKAVQKKVRKLGEYIKAHINELME